MVKVTFSTMGSSKKVSKNKCDIDKHRKKYGNGTQTGSTYISENMTDIIKIPTANLGFSTEVSSKSLGDSNDD